MCASEPTTVFAPYQPTVFGHQVDDFLGDLCHEFSLPRVGQVKCWSHVYTTDVGVAEHAVHQSGVVEGLTEASNERWHLCDRHRTVFDKGSRASRQLGATHRDLGQQADGIGSHLPNR